MDTIELRPLHLTRRAFFWLLVKLRMRRYGWLYGLFAVVGVYVLLSGAEEQVPLGFILLTLPFISVGMLYHWAYRKDNDQLFMERKFMLNEQHLVGTVSSGGRSEIPWSSVQRIVEIDGRYLLYLSAGQMIILDKLAFPDRSSEDRFLFWVKDIQRKRA